MFVLGNIWKESAKKRSGNENGSVCIYSYENGIFYSDESENGYECGGVYAESENGYGSDDPHLSCAFCSIRDTLVVTCMNIGFPSLLLQHTART